MWHPFNILSHSLPLPCTQLESTFIFLPHYIFLLSTCHYLKIYQILIFSLVFLFQPLDNALMSIGILHGWLLCLQSLSAQHMGHAHQIFVERMREGMNDGFLNTICHHGSMKTYFTLLKRLMGWPRHLKNHFFFNLLRWPLRKKMMSYNTSRVASSANVYC